MNNKLEYTMKNTILTASALACTSAIAQERPNIILFLVDDMGVMDTSVPFLTDAEGKVQTHPLNQWYHTPNMERLASQGIRFSTFYAQSVSSPSRTSIMTGQNAARHRTTNWINSESNNRTEFGPHEWNWEGLNSHIPVYPKLLQEAGYRTIHVGKAHFGCIGSEGEDPRNVGFDVNIGGNSIGQPGSYYGEWGYGLIKGNKSRAVPGLEKYHGSDVFLTDALTLEAEAEMEKAVKEGKPFYLNMSHYAVHQPFEADKRYLDKYKDSGKGHMAEAFATLVEGMDKSLGDLIEKLEELGVAENTLILFLGDNGGDAPLGGPADYGSSAPLRGKKGSEYEGGVRVPFIAWGPGMVPAGVVNDHQLAFYDVMPTFCELAGVKDYVARYTNPNKEVDYFDGLSFAPTLLGKEGQQAHDFLYWEFEETDQVAVRMGDWKMVSKAGKPHLYDLKTDVHEDNDLADQHPDIVKQMVEIAHSQHTESPYFKVTMPIME